MKIKEFGMNKTYAINYLRKIKENDVIKFCAMSLSFQHHGYIVMYSYK